MYLIVFVFIFNQNDQLQPCCAFIRDPVYQNQVEVIVV